MRRMKRAVSVVAGVSALLLAASTQAHASTNSGWVWTTNKGGKAYFVADATGTKETVKVCDEKTNNRGVKVSFYRPGDGSGADSPIFTLTDKTNNDKCVIKTSDWFKENLKVTVKVEEFHGTKTYNTEYGDAVS